MLEHRPVLATEVVAALAIRDAGCYLDGTFGRGGHSRLILDRLSAQGSLIALDRDPEAMKAGQALMVRDGRFQILQLPFGMALDELKKRGQAGRIDGLLLDLGVSSPQLDDAGRGFSFQADGPLDMRMDPGAGAPVADWLATASVDDMARWFREYGEERHARRVARAIERERERQPIRSTRQLAELIARQVPRERTGKHPATRCFQALRILVNDELGQLRQLLGDLFEIMAPGGRVVIISFHSLEDRLVKRFFRDNARGEQLPSWVPVTGGPPPGRLRPLGKAVASDAERTQNPRSRSAVMRVAEIA